MKNRVLSWLLVAAMLLSCLPAFGMPVHAEEPATEGEDLFSNATCEVGVKQTEVTNGSNEAWKLTPGTDWKYPQFVLGREYDISNHILIMDVMPVETSMDRLHIVGTTGASWVSAEIYDTLPAGQWTTVTYDLSANSAGATSMSDITFGMRIYSMEETGGLYIDNVRLIEKDTDDLFYGGSGSNEHISKQYDVTNGSGEAWKFVPNAAEWRYFGITLNGSHDITNHKLVVDVMPVDITVARFHITSVSGQSYPSNDTLIESLTPGVWQTVELDLSIAAADEITSIEFGARFDSITGENPALYFDNARLVEPDTDLLGSAAVSGGTIQYNVTNNSNASFKIKASAAGEWKYFDFTLPAGYDVSDHNLVFDLIPVDLTMSRFHITSVSGQSYPSNDTIIDTFKPDAWQTVALDLSVATAKEMTSVSFGLRVDSITGKNPAIYIDNVRVVKHDQDDLLYGASAADAQGFFSGGNYSYNKNSAVVNGENSTSSWCFTAAAGANDTPAALIGLGKSVNMTGKYLALDVLFDNANGYIGIVLLADSNWAVVTADGWNVKSDLPTGEWTTVYFDIAGMLAEGKTLDDIYFVKFVFAVTENTDTVRNIYVDNLRLVDEIPSEPEPEPTEPEPTEPEPTEPEPTEPDSSEPEETEPVVCEHDWGYGVTTQKPTLEAEGVKTYTCSKCGETKTEAIDKLVGNGSTVDEWSLTLKGDINVNFDMALDPAIAADPNAYVLFTVDGKEYKFTAAEAASQLTIPVAAAQMKDQIQVTVYDGNGTAGTTFTYSVHQYADYILRNSEDENLKALVKNMLNYGAKAQEYFDHNANDLANEDVSVDEVEPNESYNTPAVITGQFAGFEYYGASLVLREKVYIRFYFTAENGVADLTFFYGNEPLTVYKAGANLYFVETAGINPHEYSSNAVITVQQDGNDTTYSVGYSVMNYIARNYYRDGTEESLKATLKAMYGYHLAAVAYIPTT